jgi:hypothetical protein
LTGFLRSAEALISKEKKKNFHSATHRSLAFSSNPACAAPDNENTGNVSGNYTSTTPQRKMRPSVRRAYRPTSSARRT